MKTNDYHLHKWLISMATSELSIIKLLNLATSKVNDTSLNDMGTHAIPDATTEIIMDIIDIATERQKWLYLAISTINEQLL